jgi:hypothetical protein
VIGSFGTMGAVKSKKAIHREKRLVELKTCHIYTSQERRDTKEVSIYLATNMTRRYILHKLYYYSVPVMVWLK